MSKEYFCTLLLIVVCSSCITKKVSDSAVTAKNLDKKKLSRLVSENRTDLGNNYKTESKKLDNRFHVLQYELHEYVQELGFDSLLIVGEDAKLNKEYVHEVMPSPSLLAQDRGYVNPKIQKLEKIHVELWYTDSLLRHKKYGLETRLQNLEELPSDGALAKTLQPLLLKKAKEEGAEAFKPFLTEKSEKLKEYIREYLQSQLISD